MTTEIKCPKCNSVMTPGFELDTGHYDSKKTTYWVEGEPEESFWSGLKTSDRDIFRVRTFRCPLCFYLESYTADKVFF